MTGLHKNFFYKYYSTFVSFNIDPDRVKTDSGVEDSRTPILINNLDLKLINQSCIYPKLNPDIINQGSN
jgi:hypothetical protein